MGDHPEAVRDGFRDGLPVPWQGFAEEPEDRFGELAEVRVEPVARSVRRETRPDAVLRPLQKELQRLRVRVAGTIQEDIDCPACRGGRAPAPSAASGSSRCRRPVWTRSRACPRERTGRTSGDASRISRPYPYESLARRPRMPRMARLRQRGAGLRPACQHQEGRDSALRARSHQVPSDS